jgi:tRNA A-37 threonylcarbamoyl transferase component Bud32
VSSSPLFDQKGVRWLVEADWQEALLDANGLNFASGPTEVVKDGPHRTVYRVDLPDVSLFVKRYRASGLRGWFAKLAGRSAARREFVRTKEVIRRSVPTVRAVAVGEPGLGSRSGDSFFVTEAVHHSCTLQEYCRATLPELPASERSRMRRKLVTSLARLCAASHDAGVLHDDLHAGNILVRLDTCDPRAGDDRLPQLLLIDLPGVSIGRPLDWRRSRSGLRMLCAGWRDLATRSERWRFWREYLRRRPRLRVSNPREVAREIWHDAFVYARKLLRRRDARALKTNRDFLAASTRDYSAHAVRDLAPEDLQRVLADPLAPLLANLRRPIKLSHGSIVVDAEFPLGGRQIRVAYKRSRVKRWWKSIFAGLRASRALQAWRLGHALLQRGIATARPLAVCEPRRFSLRSSSYLITEWIEGAENMHLYLWRVAERAAPERRRRARECAQSLGRLVGRMHAWDVAHRDLKGCNLVAVEGPNGVETRLIDLDGVRIVRRLGQKTKMRNLARIAVSAAAHPWLSRTDRLRFLRAYLRELPNGGPRWKQVWRDVTCHALKAQAALRRQGAQIA